MFLRFCVLLITLLGVACGDDVIPIGDAGPGDSMVVETGVLALLSEASLSLAPGETAVITVRYTNAGGQPIPNEEARFAFDGNANDSSLDDLLVVTGADGVASTEIVAGTVPGTFRVRANVESAPPVYVDVVVGEHGFGTLDVIPEYEGDRQGTLGAVVFFDVPCDDEQVRLDRERYQALGDVEPAIRFLNLPAETPLTVVSRLDGRGGALLSWGCKEDVTLDPGEVLRVRIPLQDEPLEVTGAYDTALRFSVLPLAEWLGEALSPVAEGGLSSGSRILNSIARTLEADALRILQAERAAGLDSLFDAVLVREDAGPRVPAQLWLTAVAESLTTLTLGAELRVGEEIILATRSLANDRGPFDLPGSTLSAPVDLRATVDGETLVDERLLIQIAGGDLARGVAMQVAEDLSADLDLEDWFVAASHCDRVDTPSREVCDEDCAQAACEQSARELYGEFLTVLDSTNESWAGITLAGSLQFSDDSGDLIADEIAGPLRGQWQTQDTEVEADAQGSRLIPPM